MSLILAFNPGSSSLKYAVYNHGQTLSELTRGAITRVGADEAELTAREADGQTASETLGRLDQRQAMEVVLDRLATRFDGLASLAAIGFRVVHGGPHYRVPTFIDASLIAALRDITSYAPEHLPAAIAAMDLCRQHFRDLPQVACFDTGFHRTLPDVARQLPIPRRLWALGLERYGFHGLSYAYVAQALADVDPLRARGRVVLAHLGNGVSLTAMRDMQSIDTTMGFTPAAGVPMGTRSGDLDPGLVRFLFDRAGMDAAAFDHMASHEAGLLGMSETGSDVRDLLAREADDARAAEAIALFCYRIRKEIGALAAALGGIDALVFTGGIGEHAAEIRARACEGLGFLGIRLDPAANQRNAPVISSGDSVVSVRVIATDEEAVIARDCAEMLHKEIDP